MEEKRKYVRLDSSINVRCSLLESDAATNESVSKNISIGGIMVPLKYKLAPGTKLHLELELPLEPKPISIIGEVVWQKTSENQEFSDTGIRYLEIDDADMQKMTSYLLGCLRTKIESAMEPISEVLKKKLNIVDLFSREIRIPGDKSITISAPNFLIEEVNIPGDKIRHSRLAANIEFKWKTLDGKQIEERSLSQYLSSAGVWLLLDKDLPEATIMELKIQIPDSGEPIIATGEVLLSKRETRHGKQGMTIYHEAKARFLNIPAEARKRIIRYLYSNPNCIMLAPDDSPQWI